MRRLFVYLAIFGGLLWASMAYAAGPYYEFNPDYAQSLLVASGETPSEVFLPLNDFLSGFDLWLSNGSIGGDVTFVLLGTDGQILTSRTVTLPAIADDESGTRFHVNLASQIAVTGNAAYRIRIDSTLPTLRLYYAPQVHLLTYNGTPPPAYTGGLARLGSQDQAYSFKFALYENNENAPPILTNVSVSQTAIDQAVLTFNANEPVDYRVQYDDTMLDWTGVQTSCPPLIHTCTVPLPVQPSTLYNFTLTAKDSWGNQSAFSGTFTSLANGQTPTPTPAPGTVASPVSNSPTPTPDTIPPVISNLRVVDLTPDSAGFAWTTDEAANGIVVVQLTPILITAGGNSDSTLELEHYISVGHLMSDTYYQATVRSADAVNNTTTATITFLTPRVMRSPAPTPTPTSASTPTPSPTTTGPANEPIISWPAPISGEPPEGYRIDIFDGSNHLIKTITVSSSTHSIALVDLPEGQQRVVIYADDGGVYRKVAPSTAVTVGKRPILQRLLPAVPYSLGGLALVMVAAIGFLRFRARHKKIQPPGPTGMPPAASPKSTPPIVDTTRH
jgi:hypothetical protein